MSGAASSNSPIIPASTTSPTLPSLAVRERLEALRVADTRFTHVEFTLSDNIVSIRGRVATLEDLMELARRVSCVPAVRQVDVRGVRVDR
jgi:hypothetical protein